MNHEVQHLCRLGTKRHCGPHILDLLAIDLSARNLATKKLCKIDPGSSRAREESLCACERGEPARQALAILVQCGAAAAATSAHDRDDEGEHITDAVL